MADDDAAGGSWQRQLADALRDRESLEKLLASERDEFRRREADYIQEIEYLESSLLDAVVRSPRHGGGANARRGGEDAGHYDSDDDVRFTPVDAAPVTSDSARSAKAPAASSHKMPASGPGVTPTTSVTPRTAGSLAGRLQQIADREDRLRKERKALRSQITQLESTLEQWSARVEKAEEETAAALAAVQHREATAVELQRQLDAEKVKMENHRIEKEQACDRLLSVAHANARELHTLKDMKSLRLGVGADGYPVEPLRPSSRTTAASSRQLLASAANAWRGNEAKCLTAEITQCDAAIQELFARKVAATGRLAFLEKHSASPKRSVSPNTKAPPGGTIPPSAYRR